MKNILLISILWLGCFLAGVAQSAEIIAVVDMDAVLQKSKAVKSINTQMKKIREDHQADITKKEEALRKGEKELAGQHKLLAKEAFAEKEKAFKKKIINFQRDIQEKRAAIDIAFNQAIKIVEKTIYKIVEDISKEEKLKLVVQSSQTLFVDNSLNITEKVLKKLDSALPKVNIEKKKD